MVRQTHAVRSFVQQPFQVAHVEAKPAVYWGQQTAVFTYSLCSGLSSIYIEWRRWPIFGRDPRVRWTTIPM
jgi:hypothetical protein